MKKKILTVVVCVLLLLAQAQSASAFLTQESSSTEWHATVASDSAVLYSGLSPTSAVVALLTRGEPVTINLEITKEDGKWYAVNLEQENSVAGYINGRDLAAGQTPNVTLWEFQPPPEPASESRENENNPGGAAKRLVDRDIKSFIISKFGHTLPISAFGQTSFHDHLRFDHRNAVDVALHPDSPDGRVLLNKLRSLGVPFIAFRHAVPGVASGAHIHVGRPSPRK